MRITRLIVAGLGVVAVAAFAACGGDDESGSGDSGLPQGGETVDLNPADFKTEIDNPWWPMEVGARWVYRETDQEGSVQRDVVTVTDKTKPIANGVEARVVHDVASEDGEPIEITDDWYAQDADGNVWYLGEDTAEYENGKVKSRAGSFEAGVDGAQAGVIMPADPQVGQSYRQEYYKGHAEDAGKNLSLDEQVEVPAGHFTGVHETAESNPLEPKVDEHQFFAKGVGPVLALTLSGGSDREELLSYSGGK
jgi:hypothetical protein